MHSYSYIYVIHMHFYRLHKWHKNKQKFFRAATQFVRLGFIKPVDDELVTPQEQVQSKRKDDTVYSGSCPQNTNQVFKHFLLSGNN